MRPRLDQLTRRATAAVGALAVGLAGALTVVSTAAPAAADTAPSDTTLPVTVSSDALPTAQIDGIAWDQEIAGTTVFVGGKFAKVRPAGAAPGASTVTRSNAMAYDIRTGQYTGFAPTLNGAARALAVSPDGTRVYMGGEFTSVNGDTSRKYIAAFSTSTGALITAFKPILNGRVAAVTATNTTVYLGGVFTTVGGQTRTRVAAVSASTGAPLASVGSAEGTGVQVTALKVSPDEKQLVIGGSFTTFNGSSKPGYGLARVDLTSATRAMLPLPVNDLIRNGTTNAAITSLSGDADHFYGTGYVFGSGGNFEGTFAARWTDGALVWVEDCHGDTHQAAPIGGIVYAASHKHYCGNIGGFPEFTPRQEYRATAVTKAVRGTVTKDPHGYFNYAGKPAPQLLNWFPTLDTGLISGSKQGPWSVTGNSQYVVMAGEFLKANDVGQQGLVRYAVKSLAPNKDGPRVYGASSAPRVRSVEAGKVRVSWPPHWDRDNATLTHRVYRTTTTSPTTPPNTEQKVTAPFWAAKPGLFVDTVPAGSAQKYLVTVSDPLSNTFKHGLVGVTAATTATDQPYAARVLNDGASLYLRLGESSGTTAQDWVGFTDAAAGSGITRGAAGAVSGDRASTFDGTVNGFAVARTAAAVLAPNTFTVEAWVKTTSTSGGKIVGYGNAYNGASSQYDRHVYMDNAGKIYFGVNTSGNKTVSSTAAYNDGAWHHVAASLGSTGMRLYVDGKVVGSRTDAVAGQAFRGYWRIAGDSLGTSWPGTKSSGYLNGSIDDVAVYPKVLDAAAVAARMTLAGSATTADSAQEAPLDQPQVAAEPVAPTAAFTATTDGRTVDVDGSGSTDPDGTVAAYAWDFGDGSTAAGRTATHTYATAGTYTVGLRVTDDDGATGTTSRTVTVAEPAPTPTPPPAAGELARDAFERSVTGAWGDAEAGGAWSVTGGGGSFSVAGGVGRQVLSVAGRDLTAGLSGTATDTEVQVVVALDKLATGGGTYVSVVGRELAAAGDYGARVRVLPTGVVNLATTRAGSPVGGRDLEGVTYAPGDRLTVRLQVTGTAPTTLRVKAWPTGTTEPAAWHVTSTDATAGLQAGGGVGVGAYLSGSATNAPVLVTFDDLWAGAPRG